MTLTDTHCHLDFNKFDEDRRAVIERAREAGLRRMLVPGLDLESSRAAIELAALHSDIFAAVGFHPTDAEKWDGSSYGELKRLITNDSPTNRIVAIGEVGIDYYWVKESENRAWQLEVLRMQLQLAQEANKPVIIHMREQEDAWFGQASVDLLRILAEWHSELRCQDQTLAERPGVLHSFNGTLETAQRAMELNFYVGVTGPVTYKNAEEKRRIIRALPLERLLIETDSPFLTPVPQRGKRNEPAFVIHIADKIAEIHDTTREQVAEITTSNAARLFGWGG